jgi:hypothetical protein
VSGDFNGDGRTDLALVGVSDGSIPVAFSTGRGGWRVTTSGITSGDAAFTAVMSQPNVRAIPGDFNNDGYADIALSGGDWQTIPIAFSNGDASGTFHGTNKGMSAGSDANFTNQGATSSAAASMPTYVPGDFDGDGKSDILIVTTGPAFAGVYGVALSNGDGTFRSPLHKLHLIRGAGPAPVGLPLEGSGPFEGIHQMFMPVAGDFNGDGLGDVAFMGPDFTDRLMVLFSTGDGQFRLVQPLALSPGVNFNFSGGEWAVPGDFNGDGFGDIVVTGDTGILRTLFSQGDGTFLAVSNGTTGDPGFPSYAQLDGATPVSGWGVAISTSQFATTGQLNSTPCSLDSQCASNHCATHVCCDTACTGPCNACYGGTCQPLAANTGCGLPKTGTVPSVNDVNLICDGAGNCVAPTIPCGSSQMACNLNTNVCCNTATSGSDPVCAQPWECCGQPGVACSTSDVVGENCKSGSDCENGRLCCVQGGQGFKWNQCNPQCDGLNTTVCTSVEICLIAGNVNIPCVPDQTHICPPLPQCVSTGLDYNVCQ